MSLLGKYCKAYPVERLRAFPGWIEKDWKASKGSAAGTSETEISGEPEHFYLQENYVVTADIFLDEQVVFDQVNEEWLVFCRDVLGFRNPFEKEVAAAQEKASDVLS